MSTDQKKEITWNIVNSILAGMLVFFGALVAGNIELNTILAALGASAMVAVTKFRDYWQSEEKEYRCMKVNAFNFL